MLLVIGPNCALNHDERNKGRAWGQKNAGLCKYLRGIHVGYPSVLFRSAPPADPIASGNINTDVTSALEMDATRT